jgi:hypothetical protein
MGYAENKLINSAASSFSQNGIYSRRDYATTHTTVTKASMSTFMLKIHCNNVKILGKHLSVIVNSMLVKIAKNLNVSHSSNCQRYRHQSQSLNIVLTFTFRYRHSLSIKQELTSLNQHFHWNKLYSHSTCDQFITRVINQFSQFTTISFSKSRAQTLADPSSTDI